MEAMVQIKRTAHLNEAESHVPALKNRGKSDCAVWIVGIEKVEFYISKGELSQLQTGDCE
jgi:hypothetical protein